MISIKRLFKSFTYAFKGLVKVFKEEQNFKIELLAGLVVLLLAWFFKVSHLELAVLVLVIGLVLLAEVINSVVELISDILKPKLDHYVKNIKDMVAAAVMISSVVAVVVGIIIFSKYIFV